MTIMTMMTLILRFLLNLFSFCQSVPPDFLRSFYTVELHFLLFNSNDLPLNYTFSVFKDGVELHLQKCIISIFILCFKNILFPLTLSSHNSKSNTIESLR